MTVVAALDATATARAPACSTVKGGDAFGGGHLVGLALRVGDRTGQGQRVGCLAPGEVVDDLPGGVLDEPQRGWPGDRQRHRGGVDVDGREDVWWELVAARPLPGDQVL